jgi:hypothetical protein
MVIIDLIIIIVVLYYFLVVFGFLLGYYKSKKDIRIDLFPFGYFYRMYKLLS